MCLSSVKEIYDPPSDLIVDGWKNFKGGANKPEFSMQTHGGKSDVPLDVWIRAEATATIMADDKKDYVPGFHVYCDDHAGSTGYRRVFLRRVTCSGLQGSLKVVIAQEMYVPSNQDGWPPPPTATAPASPTPPPAPPAPPTTRQGFIDRVRGKKGGTQ